MRLRLESNVLTWRCACGRIFFSLKLSAQNNKIAKYCFYGTCSRCGRRVRRCFNLCRGDMLIATRILRVQQSGKRIKVAMIKQPNDNTRVADLAYTTKMAAYMLPRGYTVKRTSDLLTKRTGSIPTPIYNTVTEIGNSLTPYTLIDAPAFCRETLPSRKGFLVGLPDGRVVDLCPFCMITGCNKQGHRCKGVKVNDTTVRFLQMGKD